MELHGILEYEGESRNFIFSDWTLSILPTRLISNEEDFINKIQGFNSRVISYGSRTLIARDSMDRILSFVIDDFPFNNDKMIRFRVRSYMQVSEESNLEKIQRIVLTGEIIDHFFPPYKKVQRKLLAETRLVDIKLENHKSEIINFAFENHNIIVSFQTTIKNIRFQSSDSLPNMNAEMHILSDSPLSFSQFEKILIIFRDFFKLIYYSREITFDQIQVYPTIKIEKENVGRYKAKNFSDIAVDMSKMPGINFYDFENVEMEIAEIFSILCTDDINLNFIARNQSDRNYYSNMRFIEAIASFEKNFKAYFFNYQIKKKYIDAMKEIQIQIDEITKDKSKSKKDPFISLSKHINEYNPLDKRLSYILKYPDFISSIDHLYGKMIKEDKNLIKRLNEIRNKIAHGETNIDIGTDDFFRFKFMIICVYFLVLKRARISNKSISRLLSKLDGKI